MVRKDLLCALVLNVFTGGNAQLLSGLNETKAVTAVNDTAAIEEITPVIEEQLFLQENKTKHSHHRPVV